MGGRGAGGGKGNVGGGSAPADVAALGPGARAVYEAWRGNVGPTSPWVRLPEIRGSLAARGMGRKAQDKAITDFALSRKGHVIPIANLKSLRPADRAAALRLGGQDVHAIAWDP